MSKERGTTTERDELGPTVEAPAQHPPDAPSRTEPLGPAAPDTVQARLLGRFRLDAPLGSGGMADVYRAYDPMLDRAVAIKVLRMKRAGDDPQRMRRVLREARAAAALSHPNTVTIFDVGEADGEVFIAMELLEGEALRAVLARGDAPLEQKVRWLLETARALAAAHERGLVHRDVKPDNIFICRGGTLKLLDFGIAKRNEDDTLDPTAEPVGPSSLRTTEGRRIGTPRYMAPEQHAGLPTDGRTDEYAWGLVAFELLTGLAPGAVPTATMAKDGSAPANAAAGLDDLLAKVPDLSPTITRTIMRALEPHKEDRFASMAPIVSALENELHSADRDATGPSRAVASAASQETQAVRPRPRRWVAASLVALSVLVGAGIAARRFIHAPLVASTPDPAKAVPPACRVVHRRSLSVKTNDRAAMLPDGTLVVARDIRRGVVLDREAPSGMVPFEVPPAFSAIEADFRDLSLIGVTYDGLPGVLLKVEQEMRGTMLWIWTRGTTFSMTRIEGPITSMAFAPFGRRVAAVLTTMDVASAPERMAAGAEADVIGGMRTRGNIEPGAGASAAVATSTDRIAAAYLLRGQLHFALLDASARRLGDVLTVAKRGGPPAVAFAGTTSVVFWSVDDGARRRLDVATFGPSDKGFSAPKIAVDESVVAGAPVAAQLPNGTYALGWLASSGAGVTLRVAPVGAGGSLTGITDIDTGTTFGGLQAITSSEGITFSWSEGETMKFARVTCNN